MCVTLSEPIVISNISMICLTDGPRSLYKPTSYCLYNVLAAAK